MLMREKKALKEARTGKKAYQYALCIGGRKLLVSICYILKNRCRWNSIEVPKEVIERVKKHLDTKVKKFQTQLKDLNKVLESMEEIYTYLFSLDYPSGITKDLRHKTDVGRNIIEKTRGDISLTLQMKELSKFINDKLKSE